MKFRYILLTVCMALSCLCLVSCDDDNEMEGDNQPTVAQNETNEQVVAPAPQTEAKPEPAPEPCCDLCEATGGLLCRKNLAVLNQEALDKQLKDGALTKVSLFDGQTLDGWTKQDGKPIEKGWVVEDGTIYRNDSGGSLHTAKEYTNFIFDIEWKISPKGNSGIKYRFTKYGNSWNGPEYQVLDDAGHPDAKLGDGKRKVACLYDILAADTSGVYKEPGEWNQTRIVAYGPIVQHWLNGKMVLQYNTDTQEFKDAVQASKFKDYPNYAAIQTGRIHLQDHNDPVWYRNISMIELPAGEQQ